MKKKLILACLFLSSLLYSQGNGYNASRILLTSTTGADISLPEQSLIGWHQISWIVTGSPAACTLKLEQSANGSVWTDLIANQTCTSNGSSAISAQILNAYVRLNVTAFSGGTTPTITATYEGWAFNPNSGGGGGSGTVTEVDSGTGLSGGPITTTGTLNIATTGVGAGSCTNCNLTYNAQGQLTVAANGSSGGAVSSVFTRTGAVVATSGDYTVAQVTGAAPIASPTFTTGITTPQVTLAGTTSGTSVLSMTATGGTIVAGNLGTLTNPWLQATGASSNTGLYWPSTSSFALVQSGIAQINLAGGGIEVSNANFLAFSSTSAATATRDTTTCRASAGVFEVNAGASCGNTGAIQVASYQTATNCAASGTAANPSVVTCTAANAGAVYCDVAASAGTCTVNTTAITANSEILVTLVASEGTRLSKTCNPSPSVVPGVLLAAKVTATSFTVNMPTGVTNGFCFDYLVVN